MPVKTWQYMNTARSLGSRGSHLESGLGILPSLVVSSRSVRFEVGRRRQNIVQGYSTRGTAEG